ncbi:MAG: cation transporter [Candidatus Eisenbacteria bacterium]|uniref:Cation transporter n=1 Tax=Eiseniibacteriota bacterium TaxID=2212470 RepID=A0A849SXR2_UNCEI|nr:cation transporter [Candidatus Eisenbacteria bacterium]
MSPAETPPRSESRAAGIARVLWWVLVLNLIVAAAKLGYGWRSGAISITADGLHSILDASSNVFGLIGLHIARKPPDADHPYGHRKYETFSALAIAVMMFVGSWEILSSAFTRLATPRVPQVSVWGFAIMGATLVINGIVVAWERRAARRLQSELLSSDAEHTQSDVLASVLVLLSFAAARFGIAWADVVAAVLIVGLIMRAGIVILRTTLSTLADERRLDPVEVEGLALEESGVREAHNVRSRGAADHIHVDLHVLVAPDTTIAHAHALGHRVEARIRGRWPTVSDVVVHVEPALDAERARERIGGALHAEG